MTISTPAFVAARVAQFRDQVARRLGGELTEEQFRPHRLMNGLYLQLHAYMLRIAVPYGVLNSRQMRKLADIARNYDRGYGHFTTRQNIQFNWPTLKDMPDILAELSSVEMHAIQTSGNCIRNVTADHFAGVAADEIADPRPYAEILRQWSSLHPEFSFLPRKFKIAVNGGPHDRAVIQAHDIGLQVVRDEAGAIGFAVYVGGGFGRTPMIGHKIRDFLPESDLLAYVEAILRVYNLEGRRDNKYKARIKILVHEKGLEACARRSRRNLRPAIRRRSTLPRRRKSRGSRAYFAPPAARAQKAGERAGRATTQARTRVSRASSQFNLTPHKTPGYVIVTVSLKPIGGTPATRPPTRWTRSPISPRIIRSDEIRVSHEQNLILPHVALDDLPAVYDRLASVGLATPNAGAITDIIACPGLDYCALATARSIPVAQRISEHFGDGARAQSDRPAEDQDLRLHQRLRPSSCRPYRHSRTRAGGRGNLPDHARRLGRRDSRDRPDHRAGLLFGERGRRDRDHRRDLHEPAGADGARTSSTTFRRVGMAPFKEALYERSAGSDI